MFDDFPLKLITSVTWASLKLAWKSGLIVTAGLMGLATVLIFIPFNNSGPFTSFVFTIYLILLGVGLGTSLVFGLYIGIYAGLLTHIFQKYLPASRKYRQVIMWGVFASCFVISYVFLTGIDLLKGAWEIITLVLAAYGGWLAVRLVDWIEEFGGMLPIKIAKKKEAAFLPVYRIKKLREKGLTRYEIDAELLKTGFNPDELETAWEELNLPETGTRFNWSGWSRVLLSTIIPAVVVAGFAELVSLMVW